MTAEGAIATAFGGAHAVLFGRARSALFAVFETLGLAGRPILLPSNACPSLMASVWAAGAAPRLVDVDPDTGAVPDAGLARRLEDVQRADGPGLVLITHLYGFRLDYSQTRAAARRAGWSVVENDANATTRATGAPLEDPVRIVSFGAGKVVDAGAGGAAITNDPALAADLVRLSARWPAAGAAADARETRLALARRALRQAGRSAEIEALLIEEIGAMRLGWPKDGDGPLHAALAGADASLAARAERSELWRAALAGLDGLSVVDLPQPAPWRLIVRADEALRDRALAVLRADGFDAGANYPALAREHPQLLAGQASAASDLWGARALNLWLDARYDRDRIGAAAARLARLAEAAT